VPDHQPLPDAERVAYVEQVKRDAAAALLAIPGVHLVALGGKETGGRNTGELVIRVHVANKRPAGEVPSEELIPAEIDGVRTDVVSNNGKRLIVAPPGGLVRWPGPQRRHRRPDEAAGAGRGAAQDRGQRGRREHVRRHAGLRAVEPGQPRHRLCADQPARAVVRLAPGTKWVAEILEIGVVAGSRPLTPIDAVVNTPVRKRGVRTKLTGGVVTDVGGLDPAGDLSILVSANDNPARLANELLFFVEEGDSGSVLVDDDNKIVALLYARELTRAEITAQGGTPEPRRPARRDRRDLRAGPAARGGAGAPRRHRLRPTAAGHGHVRDPASDHDQHRPRGRQSAMESP
jgi:hypothetical protein